MQGSYLKLRSQKDFSRKENLQLASSRCVRDSQRGRGSGEGRDSSGGHSSDQGASERDNEKKNKGRRVEYLSCHSLLTSNYARPSLVVLKDWWQSYFTL